MPALDAFAEPLRTARRAAEPLPKMESAPRHVFRYLTVPKDDRERTFLACELVKCGKPRCRCAHGLKHGPYFYLRYQEYDHASGGSHFRREYVPRSEVPRVRRWIRRNRKWTYRGADVRAITPTAVVPTSPAPPLRRWDRVDVMWGAAQNSENSGGTAP